MHFTQTLRAKIQCAYDPVKFYTIICDCLLTFSPSGSLSGKTISMSTIHSGDIPEYYAHPFYGLQESMATNLAVTAATKERAFVLSRSTYMSSGVYTGESQLFCFV